MYKIITGLVLLSVLFSSAEARRGGPNVSTLITRQLLVVDSDDDHVLKPTYYWVDTLFWLDKIGHGGPPTNRDKPQRIDFTNPDEGFSKFYVPNDSFTHYFMGTPERIPPRAIGVNGVICIDTPIVQANNHEPPLYDPVNPRDTFPAAAFGVVAPLWADMELRTTGDSSKVFYRATRDTCYI